MYRFEKKFKEAVRDGVRFSEAQKTYLRCASSHGIDIINSFYEKYTREYINHYQDEDNSAYLDKVNLIISIMDAFDDNLSALVDQMIGVNGYYF